MCVDVGGWVGECGCVFWKNLLVEDRSIVSSAISSNRRVGLCCHTLSYAITITMCGGSKLL